MSFGVEGFVFTDGAGLGGVQLVGRRRRLLNYLSRTEHDRYLKLIADLGLRR